jgi:fatty acid desaturase
MRLPPETTSSAHEELKAARLLVADLLRPSAARYWADLLVGAAIGWGALAVACTTASLPAAVIAGLISAMALYRIFVFIHELTHISMDELPGFRVAWNLLVGVPMLLPSIFYEGAHLAHHKSGTYGTPDDPEYLPFAGRKSLIAGFLLFALVSPPVLLFRFLVVAPLAWMIPAVRRWADARGSTYTINPWFVRRLSADEIRELRTWEVVVTAFWGAAAIAFATGLLPIRVLAAWMLVYTFFAIVNQFRVLVAHRYELEGTPTDRVGQLRDSIDHPDGFWAELWAPLGLRYHALHHLFPTLPYHNMALAYRRLVAGLPAGGVYREFRSPGGAALWRELLQRRTSR